MSASKRFDHEEHRQTRGAISPFEGKFAGRSFARNDAPPPRIVVFLSLLRPVTLFEMSGQVLRKSRYTGPKQEGDDPVQFSANFPQADGYRASCVHGSRIARITER